MLLYLSVLIEILMVLEEPGLIVPYCVVMVNDFLLTFYPFSLQVSIPFFFFLLFSVWRSSLTL